MTTASCSRVARIATVSSNAQQRATSSTKHHQVAPSGTEWERVGTAAARPPAELRGQFLPTPCNRSRPRRMIGHRPNVTDTSTVPPDRTEVHQVDRRPYRLGMRSNAPSATTRREWGRRIRAQRKRARVTQLVVAEHLGATRQTVSAWERGITYPSLQSRIALAEMFGVEVAALFPERRRARTRAA